MIQNYGCKLDRMERLDPDRLERLVVVRMSSFSFEIEERRLIVSLYLHPCRANKLGQKMPKITSISKF